MIWLLKRCSSVIQSIKITTNNTSCIHRHNLLLMRMPDDIQSTRAAATSKVHKATLGAA